MRSRTRTLPYSLTRPTSLRPRSTSMTCSESSLASESRSAARRSSSSSSWERARVPAMGRFPPLPIFDAHKQLGRRADDVNRRGLLLRAGVLSTGAAVDMQPQEVHVGRRIHDAQSAIDGEEIVAGIDLEALREDGLK